jgi:hypothetical protein
MNNLIPVDGAEVEAYPAASRRGLFRAYSRSSQFASFRVEITQITAAHVLLPSRERIGVMV